MADQLPELVKRMQAEGVPEAEIMAFVDQFDDVKPSVSHATPKRPEQILAASDPNYMGAEADQLGARANDRLPGMMAGAAAMAAGPGIIGPAIAAGGAGYLGARLRGDSREDAAVTGIGQGALTAGSGLAAKGLVSGGQWIAKQADPLIQSAVKPTIAELRKAAGSAGTSLQAQARRISGIIRRTGIRTPEAAEEGIKAAERKVQESLASVGPDAESVTVLTDAPQRAGRYLGKLGRGASRQMSPADDVATIANERGKFERSSPLFQTVSTPAKISSELTNSAGSPLQTAAGVTRRVPRANVTAGESLELARGTSRNATRKSWGEQAGMSVEAQKALERAGRDAAKAAAPPEMQAALKAEGDLIRLKPILDRMMVREANRDAMSLPGLVGAAPALAQGKVPLLGLAAQWMRNNQLKAGMGAMRVGPAIEGVAPAVSHGDQSVRLLQMLLGGQE